MPDNFARSLPTMNRRAALGSAMAVAGAGALARPTLAATPAGDTIAQQALDEAYWAHVAAQYDVTRQVIQLENGNWGMMARPVLDAYKAQVERVNRENSYYARRGMGADLQGVHETVAGFLRVDPDEILFTRNATEALKALIGGYNRIGPGQTALFADLDYDSMQTSLVSAMARRGAKVTKIALPEPASHDAVIAAYRQAFDADPTIRLVLLTHISHRTGLMIPVREIVGMARERGIDAVVDAAHSLGQADFTLPDLGADFVGINLHKWIGAPLGAGVIYIRRNRLGTIDRDIAEDPTDPDRIDTRVHTGTVDFAALLTVPDALAFQANIGAPLRAARLRALRDRWVARARKLDSVQVMTPDDARMHAGITSFRLRGTASVEGNKALAKTLLERFGIFTVHRTDLASGACIRVTPALFNSLADVDALAAALETLDREA